MHETNGQIYDTTEITKSDKKQIVGIKKRLAGIPQDDESVVQSMNRQQRRAWSTLLRQTSNRKLAYQAAQKKGWQGSMPEPERLRGETKAVGMLDEAAFEAAPSGQ